MKLQIFRRIALAAAKEVRLAFAAMDMAGNEPVRREILRRRRWNLSQYGGVAAIASFLRYLVAQLDGKHDVL